MWKVDCGCLSAEDDLLWVSECGRRLAVGVRVWKKVGCGCLSVEESWVWVSECRWKKVDCGCLSVEDS